LFVFQPKYAAYLRAVVEDAQFLALAGRDFESWREVEAAIAEARDYWNGRRHPYVWGRRRRHRAARRPGVGAMPTVTPASG
jgi:hypothetical protein